MNLLLSTCLQQRQSHENLFSSFSIVSIVLCYNFKYIKLRVNRDQYIINNCEKVIIQFYSTCSFLKMIDTLYLVRVVVACSLVPYQVVGGTSTHHNIHYLVQQKNNKHDMMNDTNISSSRITDGRRAKPTQEWESNFKSTLNRLSTQYLLLLRAASSELALEEEAFFDGNQRVGGSTGGNGGGVGGGGGEGGGGGDSMGTNRGVGGGSTSDPRGEF